MTKQHINIGQSANDKAGDPLRTAFSKVNENFDELYNSVSAVVVVSATAPAAPGAGDLWWNSESGRMYVYYGTAWVDASPVDGTGISSTNELVNGASSFSVSSDGTLTLTHPDEPNYHPLSTTLTIQKAAGNYHTISGAYGLSLQATPVPSGYGLNTNTNFVDIFHDGVSVNVNDNTWGFGTDGSLTFPGTRGSINSEIGTDLIITNQGTGATFSWTDGAFVPNTTPVSSITVSDLGATIDVTTDGWNTSKTWGFGTDGKLTFPDGTVIDPYTFTDQTTVFPGHVNSTTTKGIALTTGEITNTIIIPGTDFTAAVGSGTNTNPIAISGKNGVSITADSNNWIFGTDGKITFPGATGFQATFGSVEPVGDVLHSVNSLVLESEAAVNLFSGNAIAGLEMLYNDQLTDLTSLLSAELYGTSFLPASHDSIIALAAAKAMNPLISDQIITVAQAVSDAWDDWQAALTASVVNITVGNYGWHFGPDGTTTFPNSSTFNGVDFVAKENDELNLTIPDSSAYIGVKQSSNLTEPAAYMDVYFGKKSRIRTASLDNQTEYDWYFNPDGSLTLPDASVIASYKPVTVIAKPAVTQTITDAASAAQLVFVDTVDSAGAFSNGVFTVPYTGYYQFNISLGFSTTVSISAGFLQIADITSGITALDSVFTGQFSGQVINGSSMLELTAGHAIVLFFNQTSGGPVIVNTNSRLTIHRVSIS